MSKNKRFPKCNATGLGCSNIRGNNDIDVPTTGVVYDWRNCVLCLLTEILLKLKEKEEGEEE